MQKQRQSHFSKLDILDRKRDFVLFWLNIQAANWHCFNKIPKHTGRRYKKTPEAAVHRCKATLLKSHFGMGILLKICCIFSEHLFLRTPLDGCFWDSEVSGKPGFFSDHILYLEMISYICQNWYSIQYW